jgi:hypothetical protein
MSKEFIQSYYLSDLSLCNKLIDVFYQRENFEGTISGDIIDKKIKDSTDCSLCIQDLNKYVVLQSYFKELNAMIEKYKIKYTFCNDGQAKWELEKSFNIQKYKPTQAYHGWHSEVSGPINSKRHLVWMTYLNDVKQGGETEWFYQKTKIKPKKGLTIISPANWVFTHKGHTTVDEDKYIFTGWYNYK